MRLQNNWATFGRQSDYKCPTPKIPMVGITKKTLVFASQKISPGGLLDIGYSSGCSSTQYLARVTET